MSPYYRARGDLLAARQLNASDWDACQDIATWCGGTLLDLETYLAQYGKNLLLLLSTPTPTGAAASDGDWVIQGPAGFFVIAHDMFDSLFEQVGQG